MTDEDYLQRALELAEQAATQQEVPVGAVLVVNNQIIAEGFNQPIATHDPTAHAEIIVLRQAATQLKNYRLLNSTLYVTLEPCLMCAGAIIHARIQRLVFGAYDAKAGAVGSVFNVLEAKELNHRVQYQGGILAEQCVKKLQNFFRAKRVIK